MGDEVKFRIYIVHLYLGNYGNIAMVVGTLICRQFYAI
jgi:hypothetical protein